MKSLHFPVFLAVVASLLLLAVPAGAQQQNQSPSPTAPYQTPATQNYWQRYYGAPQYQGQQQQGYDQYHGQAQYYPRGGQPSMQQEYGQYQGQRDQGRYTSQGYSQSSQQQIRGRIIRTRQMDVPGTDEEILTALVECEQGRIVVDLGPCEELRDNNCQVRKGDQISASGHFARIGHGAQVFVADSVRKDGRSVDIDRSWTMTTQQLRNEAAAYPTAASGSSSQQYQGTSTRQRGYDGYQQARSTSQQYQRSNQDGYEQEYRRPGRYSSGQQDESSRLNGRVMRSQRIEMPGMQSEMLAAQLQTDDGRQILAILGPENDLQDVRVRKGDQMTLRGQHAWLNGREVILANSIVGANGETAEVSVQCTPAQRLSGEVMRTSWLQLPGMKHEVLVAQLRTDQGRRISAVLGSEDSLGHHEPQRGDQISLRGDMVNLNGQQMILAQQLTSRGEQINLNHQPY